MDLWRQQYIAPRMTDRWLCRPRDPRQDSTSGVHTRRKPSVGFAALPPERSPPVTTIPDRSRSYCRRLSPFYTDIRRGTVPSSSWNLTPTNCHLALHVSPAMLDNVHNITLAFHQARKPPPGSTLLLRMFSCCQTFASDLRQSRWA